MPSNDYGERQHRFRATPKRAQPFTNEQDDALAVPGSANGIRIETMKALLAPLKIMYFSPILEASWEDTTLPSVCMPLKNSIKVTSNILKETQPRAKKESSSAQNT